MAGSPVHNVRYSLRDYLAVEAVSGVKHEYLNGQIYAMAGGTPEHAAIAANVVTLLGVQLRGLPCRVYTSDLNVRVGATGLATYPDVTVICGRLEADTESRNSAVNPVMLVEVLSQSTAEWDRGEKFEHYRQIPSLREYVLVAHDARHIEVRRRGPGDAWASETASAGQTIRLTSVPCELAVDEVYRDALAAPAS